MRKEIRVTIADDGKVTFEAHGVKGSGCMSLTEELEQEIGEVTERRRTGEYFQSSSIRIENSIRNKEKP